MHNITPRQVTEGRLRVALQRLLDGKPERLAKVGKLSLNKINEEAGIGHSYIHKFQGFVANEATPAIAAFNKDYEPIGKLYTCRTATKNLTP